jgi:hypothetical protein
MLPSLLQALSTRRLRLVEEMLRVIAAGGGDDSIATGLSEMGYLREAQYLFLQSRTRGITRSLRRLRFRGDASLYVGEMAQEVFAGVGAAVEGWDEVFGELRG